MIPPPLHSWTVNPDEAAQIQVRLRERLALDWDGRPVHTVGGVDIDLDLTQQTARAAMVIFRYPEMVPLTAVTADVPLVFPYIPGLLAFREGPAVLAAWEKLPAKPDLLMFDGQGIAHPRGFGIASHMGVWLGLPTIGVAKSRLYGRHAEVGPNAGDWVPLYDEHDRTRVIGAVVRTREKTKPLYVSPGDHIDVDHSVEFVLACCRGYRLPETTRWAHKVGAGAEFPVEGNS